MPDHGVGYIETGAQGSVGQHGRVFHHRAAINLRVVFQHMQRVTTAEARTRACSPMNAGARMRAPR